MMLTLIAAINLYLTNCTNSVIQNNHFNSLAFIGSEVDQLREKLKEAEKLEVAQAKCYDATKQLYTLLDKFDPKGNRPMRLFLTDQGDK